MVSSFDWSGVPFRHLTYSVCKGKCETYYIKWVTIDFSDVKKILNSLKPWGELEHSLSAKVAHPASLNLHDVKICTLECTCASMNWFFNAYLGYGNAHKKSCSNSPQNFFFVFFQLNPLECQIKTFIYHILTNLMSL